MPTVFEIHAVLPRLRRFGTILVGSKGEADKIIKNVLFELLEILVQDDLPVDIEVYLYKKFVGLVPTTKTHEVFSLLPDPVTEALPKKSHVARLVFLLVYVEQFDLDKTSKIVNMSVEQVRSIRDELSSTYVSPDV